MAGSSLLLLIDDIAAILDDVAVMTKVAAKKTAGVLGDDLALNAQQVSGVQADRELPVVWAVAKGSSLNKCFLVPAALAISALIPWAIIPLLMIGGAFLCFEGAEKIIHSLFHKAEKEQHHAELVNAIEDQNTDMVSFEKNKIRGAIRTDFILSAEIIVIALGTVSQEPIFKQALVLVAIAVVMTVGVYGLVAGIVKLDDAGLYLSTKGKSGLSRSLGKALVNGAPYLMKFLSVAGMIAMFLVGGGILAHGIPAVHHGIEHITHATATLLPAIHSMIELVTPSLLTGMFGLAAGAIIVGFISVGQGLLAKTKNN